MARTLRVGFSCVTPSGFDHARFADRIANRLSAKALHRSAVDRLPGGNGASVDAVFQDRSEAAQFFEWLAVQLNNTGGPVGAVHIHSCSHALGEEATEPCDLAPDLIRTSG